jgi:hypothetical protein
MFQIVSLLLLSKDDPVESCRHGYRLAHREQQQQQQQQHIDR